MSQHKTHPSQHSRPIAQLTEEVKVVAKDVRKIKAQTEATENYFEASPGVAAINTANVYQLSQIPVDGSVAMSKRIGLYAQAKHIEIRGQIDTTAVYQVARVIVFIDKLNVTTTAPTPAEVLQTLGTAQAILSGYTLTTIVEKRFQILMDRTIPVGTGFETVKCIHFKKKLNKKMVFQGVAGSTATKNSIWVLIMSASAAAGPNVNMTSRLTYTE